MGFTRREFSKILFGAAALSLVDIETYAAVLDGKKSMRRLATQSASAEGFWPNLRFEGNIPKDLSGSLVRTAPGKSESYGVQLRHLFDGDAYMTSWNFENGKASLRGRFIPESGRLKELEAGKMLFNEYGTSAPNPRNGGKNQPSVNVIKWRGKLLGLSEGSLPSIINPETFDLEGYESFDGVVPDYLTFTAHPRFDPKTGDMFAWGFEKRPPGSMHLIRVSKKTGKAETLYKAPQRGFSMVHDAMLTENYFVILFSPMPYDLAMMQKGIPMGQALKFAENAPTRLFAYPLDNKGGKAKPISVELPPYLIFHYGNCVEIENNRIRFEMISSDDGRILKVLRNWRDDKITAYDPPRLKQVVIDLDAKKVESSKDLAKDVEFPRYDMRLTGRKSRYIYVTDRLYGENASIIKLDLDTAKSLRASIGKNRTLAEPVFVPRGSGGEDSGWLLAMGYDAKKNESFLEMRDAQTLDFAARIWAAGQHIPLGFHGNFMTAKY